jgi:hypothetical protein
MINNVLKFDEWTEIATGDVDFQVNGGNAMLYVGTTAPGSNDFGFIVKDGDIRFFESKGDTLWAKTVGVGRVAIVTKEV